jgi:hypothetical protein
MDTSKTYSPYANSVSDITWTLLRLYLYEEGIMRMGKKNYSITPEPESLQYRPMQLPLLNIKTKNPASNYWYVPLDATQ